MSDKPHRWADPLKATSSSALKNLFSPIPSFPPYTSERDAAILCQLIRINQDASAFYRRALQYKENLKANFSFKALEVLHENIINHLTSRVREILLPDMLEEADSDFIEYFSLLQQGIPYGITPHLISHLAQAEERCFQGMEHALNDGLTKDTRSFLTGELWLLSTAQRYIQELKILVNLG